MYNTFKFPQQKVYESENDTMTSDNCDQFEYTQLKTNWELNWEKAKSRGSEAKLLGEDLFKWKVQISFCLMFNMNPNVND